MANMSFRGKAHLSQNAEAAQADEDDDDDDEEASSLFGSMGKR